MGKHVVLGAGGIGRASAQALVDRGEQVCVVSRSGRAVDVPGVTTRALDVTRTDDLATALAGAATVVNALNPAAYTNWRRDWPPMASAILDAAERSGARLVTVSNLYLYGRVEAPMTERTPVAPNGVKGAVRARMWEEALARHDAGRVRAVEVRASDYIGPRTLATSLLSGMVLPRLLRGQTGWLPIGRRDVPHSWTHDGDVGELVAALALTDEAGDYGRPWHVPTDRAASVDEVLALVAEATGGPIGRLRVVPRGVVTAGGVVVPILRELRETRHQFERPFVIDGSAAEQRFGLRPTPLRDSIAQTVAAIRAGSAVESAHRRD